MAKFSGQLQRETPPGQLDAAHQPTPEDARRQLANSSHRRGHSPARGREILRALLLQLRYAHFGIGQPGQQHHPPTIRFRFCLLQLRRPNRILFSGLLDFLFTINQTSGQRLRAPPFGGKLGLLGGDHALRMRHRLFGRARAPRGLADIPLQVLHHSLEIIAALFRIAAFIGFMLPLALRLPAVFLVQIEGHGFDVVWTVLGSIILLLIVSTFRRSTYYRRRYN